MTVPPITATAPAKLILCGEHAVVYGCPAIALPLADLRATATVTPQVAGHGCRIIAPDIGAAWLLTARPNDALTIVVQVTLHAAGVPASPPPDIAITVTSEIPQAAGMGSGAAVATAVVRAVAAWCGWHPDAASIAALVYQSEQQLHGTPSGIDNTVVAYEQPIWFERRDSTPLVEPLTLAVPLRFLVGDTGGRSATYRPVGAVRSGWQRDPATYAARFAAVADIVRAARAALLVGDVVRLGGLLNDNQRVLHALGVSSPELDRLTLAAVQAGAHGAKLSGGGWGGVMLALVSDDAQAMQVAAALRAAGAPHVWDTTTGTAATGAI